jgi:uncharacterized membrane protein
VKPLAEMRFKLQRVAMRSITAIVLAATYAALVLVLPSISYAAIQIRIADILSPLSYIMGFESVLGLALGTLIANAYSPFWPWDIAIGTLCTFTYALIDWVLGRVFGYRRWMLAIITVVNSVIVGLYIGALMLGFIVKNGDPLELFLLLTGESLIPMGIGSFILIPTVKRYLRRF